MRVYTLFLVAFSYFTLADDDVLPLPNPLKPMYMAHAESATDHFYTQNFEEYNYSLTIGFQGYGEVFYLEYVPTPAMADPYNPNNQINLTLPFRRYYNPSTTDHFYTANEAEASFVTANGWQEEGVEGYIYTFQVPGSVALYRINRTNQITQDHDHFYTTSWSIASYEIQYGGWAYDCVAGYVYPQSTPEILNGFVMGYRQAFEVNPDCRPVANCEARSKTFGDFFLYDTGRTPGRNTQWVSFDFTPYGLQASADHFGVMLHSNRNWSRPYSDGSYYYGMGVAIGQLDTDPYSEIKYENFHSGYTSSETNLDLVDGQTYHVEVKITSIGDYGKLVYNINGQQRSAIFTGPSWHPEATGIFIASATAGPDWTAYITNLNYGWTY